MAPRYHTAGHLLAWKAGGPEHHSVPGADLGHRLGEMERLEKPQNLGLGLVHLKQHHYGVQHGHCPEVAQVRPAPGGSELDPHHEHHESHFVASGLDH